jgi:GAF domain-containing protein
MAMGIMAAAALEHARLSERDRVLFDVARAVSSTLELKEVAKVIAANAVKAMGAKGGSVRLIDKSRKRLELLAAHGLSRDYTDKGYLDIERSIAEALEGKPVLVFDVINDSRVQYPDAALKEGICSILSVPMVIKGVTTGILRVYTALPYEFTADDIEFLSALASAGAAAIENARLYDGIRQDFEVLMDEIVYMRRAARSMKEKGQG